jgi:DNA-directed RNA polymerase specialized sigma24 family protein
MPNPKKDQRDELYGRAMLDAMKFAVHLTGNKDHARDLVSKAVLATLDPDRMPWDPAGGKSLSLHVINVVRALYKGERAKMRVREDPVRAAAIDQRIRPWVPGPDARLRAREQQARREARTQAVREGLDDFTKEVLDLFGEDLTPAEQARKLNVNVKKVYEARRRIAERVRALPAENLDEDDEAEAMGRGEDEGEGEDENADEQTLRKMR